MEDTLFKDSNIFYNILCFLITENEKLFDRSDSKLYWTTVYHLFGVLHHAYVAIFASGLDLKSSPHVDLDNLYRFRAGYLTGWNFIYLEPAFLWREVEDSSSNLLIKFVAGPKTLSLTIPGIPECQRLVCFKGLTVDPGLQDIQQMFQTCFLTMSLVYDFMEWMDHHDSKIGKLLKYYRDVLFSGLVVPLTMFISSMFWTVYWIDRELVFPQVYDQLVPWWFNHCVHTNILIVLGMETLLQARRHPTNRKLELWLNSIAGVSYAIVYYSIYFFAHRWLYGVFGIMTWWQVCLYQLGIWGSTFVFYFVQFPINRLFHKEESSENSDKTEKKPDTWRPDSWNLNPKSKKFTVNPSL